MGWVAGPRAHRGDVERRRSRDHRRRDHGLRRARRSRSTRPGGAHRPALRREPPFRRARRAGAHRAADHRGGEGRVVRDGPREELIKRLKDAGVVVMPSIGARRHAEKVAAWGVDAVLVQGGEGGGHTGAVPDLAAAAAGGRRGRRPRRRSRRLLRRSRDSSPRWPTAQRASRWERASCSPRTARSATRSSRCTSTRPVTDTLVTTQVDGVPHRVLRTDFTERLDRSGSVTSLPRAVRNASVRFSRLSGISFRDMRAGRAMRKSQDLTWSQVVMAARTHRCS